MPAHFMPAHFMPAPRYRRPLLMVAFGFAALLTIALSGLLSPHPAPRYTVTDLGVLPGYGESSAVAVNSWGDVAGFASPSGSSGSWAYTSKRACLSHGGRLTNLGVLPGMNSSIAQGINSLGEVTGSANLPAASHIFLYSRGKMRDLGTLPGFSDSVGVGINDRGEIAVDATNSAVRPGLSWGHAFLYSGGRMMDIGVPPGCSESHARSINAAGQVAGDCRLGSGRARREHPFLYDSRTKAMTVLPVPAPYWYGDVYRVNDHEQIIGDVLLPDISRHAALWHGNQMTDLGAPPGFDNSVGAGLNDRGEAVGRCFSSSGPVEVYLWCYVRGDNALRRYLDRDKGRAFVYHNGKMQDLNELIPREADWTLEGARDINDRGQIVGYGLHHGRERGFLLTPR